VAAVVDLFSRLFDEPFRQRLGQRRNGVRCSKEH
jgi:hypothetical protein